MRTQHPENASLTHSREVSVLSLASYVLQPLAYTCHRKTHVDHNLAAACRLYMPWELLLSICLRKLSPDRGIYESRQLRHRPFKVTKLEKAFKGNI